MADQQWESAEPGVKRRIFEPGQSLMMMEVRFEAGAAGYEHDHPHEQLTYCLYGKLEFSIAGVTHTLHQGESLIIPSGARHSCVALEESALLDAFTPLREDLLRSKG